MDIRTAFVATPGYVLLSADYAQLELRIMAYFSQDEALIARLTDDSADFFFQLAAHWLKKPYTQARPHTWAPGAAMLAAVGFSCAAGAGRQACHPWQPRTRLSWTGSSQASHAELAGRSQQPHLYQAALQPSTRAGDP